MIGSGGRLYRDAREKERASKSEATVKTFQKRVKNRPPADDDEKPDEPKESKESKESTPPWVVKPHHVEPEPKRDWAELQSTLLELSGVVALSVGFGLVYFPLGIIVLGISLLAMGFVLGLPEGFTFRRRR